MTTLTNYRWLIVSIYVLSILGTFDISGQIPMDVYSFNRLNTSNGLSSQLANYYLYKDRSGFIWVSSVEGLNRFDGIETKVYLPEDNEDATILDPNITSLIFEDEKSDLWLSTVEGINKYIRNSDHFVNYVVKNDRSKFKGSYYFLHLDTINDLIWFRIGKTLCISNTKDPENPFFKVHLDININSHLSRENSSGDVLIFSHTENTSIKTYRIDAHHNIDSTTQKVGSKINTFYYDGDTSCWIGSDEGLIHLNTNTFELSRIESKETDTIFEIKDITSLDEQHLIIATLSQGIYIYDQLMEQFISEIVPYNDINVASFPHKIDRIYLDQDTTLWVSTSGRGIFFTHLPKKKFNSYLYNRKGIEGDQTYIRAISEDSQGYIWCLSKSGLFRLNNNGEVSQSFVESTYPFVQQEVHDMIVDNSDNIWICTEKGLYTSSINDISFQFVNCYDPEKTACPRFTQIKQLFDNSILAASTQGVFKVKKNEKFYSLQRIHDIKYPNNTYALISEDPNNSKIVLNEMESNIHLYDKIDSIMVLDTIIGFKHWVNDIAFNPNTSQFYISSANGLYLLQVNQRNAYLVKDTMFPFYSINSLLLDDNSNDFWFSTNRGIHKYQEDPVKYKSYSIADGLQADEFDYRSSLKTSTGKYIFGGVNGINIFSPIDIKDSRLRANPTITSIYINGIRQKDTIKCSKTKTSNISEIEHLTLGPNQNTIRLIFSGLDFTDLGNSRYKFRLSGKDKSWTLPRKENFARYADLAPGSYNFQLMASNSDGVWSDFVRSIFITILPPWYLTWWAKTIASLLMLSIIYLFYRYRVSQIKKAEAYKQKEAEFKQLAAETETAVLRLQMNPHFLFNGMNSISSYILKNDMEAANRYLIRFSKLMRSILELAANQFVTIRQEVDLLNDYITIESLRFENQFIFSIDIDENLDVDEVILPTMILQPFVENSIIHGVSRISEKGNINIKFTKHKEHFICSITDNGPGLTSASNGFGKSEHKSKALQITKKRLQLLENETGKTCTVKISDLSQIKGECSGTQVEIILPFF